MKHETIKENAEKNLRNHCTEDLPVPAKLKNHQPAFLEIPEIFESTWDWHFGRINVSKQ